MTLNRDYLFPFAELLLEAIVPVEPSEEDEERNEARAAEATRRRSPGMPFARVSAVRSGCDLDGPRGGDAAASKSPRQAPLLPGHAKHRRAQVFQLQNRSRTGPVVAQVGWDRVAHRFYLSPRRVKLLFRFHHARMTYRSSEYRTRRSRFTARFLGHEVPDGYRHLT